MTKSILSLSGAFLLAFASASAQQREVTDIRSLYVGEGVIVDYDYGGIYTVEVVGGDVAAADIRDAGNRLLLDQKEPASTDNPPHFRITGPRGPNIVMVQGGARLTFRDVRYEEDQSPTAQVLNGSQLIYQPITAHNIEITGRNRAYIYLKGGIGVCNFRAHDETIIEATELACEEADFVLSNQSSVRVRVLNFFESFVGAGSYLTILGAPEHYEHKFEEGGELRFE
ncbi:GIN domain-containing protein [Parvularcula sp. LCG005]|uniref:GIN domain-containing protein n=1 Tax=Parvularcula sp. LCG005 TaxID=3078805 RepID=UPI0029422951|nr:DUF2807 domain-containing protein [Parvularcula sp. LCG005]WOI52973.1 hypothetical protein RUI03_12525 [Parvularcula sp. LCG005]